MRIKRSAQKARQRRQRNRRHQNRGQVARRTFRCEPLESRVLLDAGGLGPDGVPDILPPDPLPPLEPGAISGRVWNDADGNREYDGAEIGLGGVVVYSDFNFNGFLDFNEPATITSFDDPVTDFDEGGLYTLDNLQPGWHNVRQVTPSGFEQTFPSLPDGYLPPPWGDASVHVTFVEQGQAIDGIDFGNQALESGAVSGLKWEDVNGNGQRDEGELGLPGVVIYSDRNQNGVLDPDEPSTVTSEDDPFTDFDESGQYVLEGLEPGVHWIKEVVPDGFQQTFPNFWWFGNPIADPPTDALFAPIPFPGGGWHDVVIESGQTVDGIDFGNQRIVAGSISGTKWEDINGDGIRDQNEPGLAGVTIYADLNLNAQFDANEPHAMTLADDPFTDFDEGGLYSFEVDPGFYYVREVVPAGFRQTFPNVGFPTPLASLTIIPPQDGAHFVSVGSGQAVDGIDFGNQQIQLGSISGVKWEDTNGNAEFDPNERGLAGVTIYADINGNGVLDASEPSTVTTVDIPETDFDEAGRYTLSGLDAGNYVIREVVPDGFRQTFPLLNSKSNSTTGGAGNLVVDEFATIEPDRLDLTLAAGDVALEQVSVTINPAIFRPFEINVFASSSDGSTIDLVNLSGPLLNGGSGDTSVFELMIIGNGEKFEGELFFFDASPFVDAVPFASIPLTVNAGAPGEGVHRITLGPGQHVDGIDFGNQRIGPSTGVVSGRKWEDVNGNREQDPNESGLAGVVIYADLDQNGVLDFNEPATVTSEDDPMTDFDEAGLYTLELEAGEHWIAEVVPDGFEQTFPNNPVFAVFPPPPGGGVHFVTLAAGQSIDGLDFGNRAIEKGSVSGTVWADLNGNGTREADEPGLAGVTVYADLNFNGQLDVGEPSTLSQEHPPFIDSPIDLTGTYFLPTRPGFQAIRQIVPDGHFQTFPTSDAASLLEQGAHFVSVESNVNIDGLDFGNQPLDNFPSGVSGRKWEDANGNGRRDDNEPGLAGVTIYADTNANGVFDANEPHAITMEDIPETDFDESGLYSIGDLNSGFHIIREVVPNGYLQTFPLSIAASPLEQGAHFVFLAPGEHVDGLDFGNLRLDVPLPGDFDNDGVVDHDDLAVWEEGYGNANAAAAADVASGPMHGGNFLTWQQNFGRAAIVPPANDGGESQTSGESIKESPVGPLRIPYKPTVREAHDVVEAAFADEAASDANATAVLTPSVTRDASRSQSVRGTVAHRAEYAAIAAAIDAALEDEF